MMAKTTLHVLIIGAGCTGLAIAQGLKNANVSFEIFDRDPSDRPQREWGMSLHWGGDYLASIVPPALRSRLDDIECDPYYDRSKDEAFVQCNGKTGEVILMMPGKMPRRVSRSKMRSLLSENLNIQHSKQLSTIEVTAESVIAKFADGTTATGTFLVGCDGSRSTVRSLLFPEQSSNISDELTLLNFPATYPAAIAQDLRQIHPVFKVSYHPTLNVMYLLCILNNPNPDKPQTWKYQNLLSWKGPPYPSDLTDPADRIARLKELGKEFAEPWRSAALFVPDDAILSIDSGSSWDPRSVENLWNTKAEKGFSRVTLAGDAAHTMLPHRGQGLNHGLQDAKDLVHTLTSGQNLEQAVEGYEKEMVARAGVEVEVSGKQAAMAHDWDRLMQSPMFKMGANKSV